MQTLNSYFQKIYVLSLKEDLVRQNLVKHTLREVDFEFVWGVSMKNMFPNISSVGELPNEFFTIHEINKQEVLHWTLGALGCAIGHRNILRRIVDDKVQTALILEDDIYDNPKKKFSLESYLLNIPSDWGLIYFGFIYPSKLMKFKFLPLYIKQIYALITKMQVFKFMAYNKNYNFFPIGVNSHIQKSGVYIGAHAYAVTNSCAKKLLDANTPLSVRSDIHLMDFVYHKKLNAFNTVYPIFCQNKTLGSNTE